MAAYKDEQRGTRYVLFHYYDWTFGEFVQAYTRDMKPKLKHNTWLTKEHILCTKLYAKKQGKESICFPVGVAVQLNLLYKLVRYMVYFLFGGNMWNTLMMNAIRINSHQNVNKTADIKKNRLSRTAGAVAVSFSIGYLLDNKERRREAGVGLLACVSYMAVLRMGFTL